MKKIMSCLLATLLLLCSNNVSSQINPKKILEKKAKEALENKPAPAAEESKKTEPVQKNKEQSNEAKGDPSVKQATLESYSKFDFVPGEKVVFYDDFSQDNIGDFPVLWNTNGSGEVVTTNLFPGRWLKFVSREAIWSDQLLKLPDNYTIEFDIIPGKGENGAMAGYGFRLMQSNNVKSFDAGSVPGKAGLHFFCEYFGRPGYRTYINGNEGDGLGLRASKDDKQYYQKENQLYHLAIWVQKARVRIYQNENKLFDLPKAFPVTSVKMDRIRFEDGAAMVSNIRIAAGAPDVRNKLLTDGKVISYGIYFDVNRDEVKPQSYGSLKEMATVLNENPTVRIKVVGHTDADGADVANLDLSQRRAVAVKNELFKTFGIEASRIETDGKGEAQPVAANDTPSNKALNRRVEFIKL
jgi:OmpA-OmpF porin, OOP family